MRATLFILLVGVAGCVASSPADGRDDTFLSDGKADTGGISEGSPEAAGVLAVANALSEEQLHSDVGLSSNAARGIADHGSTFETLAELDAVPYVGSIAFGKLLSYAKANGYVDGSSGTSEPVAHGILLDCNTPVGPDQQVTVLGNGTALTLRELTTSGAQIDRALTSQEWAAHSLKLRDDFGAHATLTKDAGSWVTRSFGDGVNEIGDADCWVDKSH